MLDHGFLPAPGPSRRGSRFAPTLLPGVLALCVALSVFPSVLAQVGSTDAGTGGATTPAPATPAAGADARPGGDPAAPYTTGDPSGNPNPTQPISDALEGRDSRYYAAGPEGKTLPEKVMRARIPVRFVSGDRGFDKDGERTTLGAKLSAVGTAAVIEYGVTDELSLQFLAPFVLRNKVGIDADTFRDTDAYKTQYGRFLSATASLLESRRLCPDAATCRQLIDGGYALPYDAKVTLPTGETLDVRARTPLKDVADSIVLNGARPSEGETGLGDIEVGALYEVLNQRGPFTGSPIFLSLGGGLRFPTGKFSDVPTAQRGTGRGTLDFGARSNLDYTPVKGFFLSWQNQAEFMLRKGRKKKSSILDSGALNTADPTSPAAVAAGSDGKGNEQDFERKGVRNVGYVKAALGLGALSEAVQSLGVNTQWKYDVDAKEYVGGARTGDPRRLYTWQIGAAWDGLAYRVPLQFFVDYDMPIAGRNVAIAAHTLSLELRGFYKF